MRKSREISQVNASDGVTTLISWGKKPVILTTRKISRLVEAVAILSCNIMQHAATARNDGGVGSVIIPEYHVHAGGSIV